MTLPVSSRDLTPAIESLSVGGQWRPLGGAEGRHAASVRRIGAGEWVDVVDGCGLRATCEVSGSDKSSLSLIVRKIVREDAPNPEVILVQALAKGGRERGRRRNLHGDRHRQGDPVGLPACHRPVEGPKAEKGRAKWEGVARAAAKQSRRAYVPVVEDVKDSRELASWVASLMDEAGVAFVCHEEATESLGAALARIQESSEDGALPARIALIVGPEGGIGAEETAQLVDAGARTIGLGDNVLRSSTAGAVALTLIRAAAGKY